MLDSSCLTEVPSFYSCLEFRSGGSQVFCLFFLQIYILYNVSLRICSKVILKIANEFISSYRSLFSSQSPTYSRSEFSSATNGFLFTMEENSWTTLRFVQNGATKRQRPSKWILGPVRSCLEMAQMCLT